MYTYKTKPEGFQEVRRTMIVRDFPLFLLAITILILVIAFGEAQRPINWYITGTVLLITAIIVGFAILRRLTTERHKYEDFVLSIHEDGITREQYGTETLTIAKQEVSEIYKKSNGTLVIKGAAGSESILIPAQIEEREKLEQELADIKPFSEMPFEEKYWFLTGVTMLSLVAIFYLASNKWLVAIIGLILLGLYGKSLYGNYRYKRLSDISKTRLLFALYIVYVICRRVFSTINGG